MMSRLEELENNEAVLLMYLAGELPPQDRAEVEQMLAGDAAMRVELERLRSVEAECRRALARLDAAGPLPASEGALARRVAQAMRQWQVDRLSKTPAPPAATGNGQHRWWLYSVATAAAAALILLAWWGFQPGGNTRIGPSPPLVNHVPRATEPDEPEMPLAVERQAVVVIDRASIGWPIGIDDITRHSQLISAEREALALQSGEAESWWLE